MKRWILGASDCHLGLKTAIAAVLEHCRTMAAVLTGARSAPTAT